MFFNPFNKRSKIIFLPRCLQNKINVIRIDIVFRHMLFHFSK